MFKVTLFMVIGALVVLESYAEVEHAKSHQSRHHSEHENHPKGRHVVHNKHNEAHHKGHVRREHHHALHPLLHSHRRNSSNQSVCSWFCLEQQLLSAFIIFNGTKELELIYSILPKPILIYPGCNITNSSSPSAPSNSSNSSSTESPVNVTTTASSININATWLPPIIKGNCSNSSAPIFVSPFQNSTSEYPIFSYLIKKFVEFLTDSRGISVLFQEKKEFAVIWRDVARNFNISNRTDILSQNLNALFGYNGSLGANIFDLNYTETLISNFSTGGFVQHIEQGIESFINGTGWFRNGEHHHKIH